MQSEVSRSASAAVRDSAGSGGGKDDPRDTPTECKSGGLHPPNQETVSDFVRQVRGRIRYFSVCGPSADIASEVIFT